MPNRFELLLDQYLGDGLEDAELDEFLTLLHDPRHPEREDQLAALLLTQEQVTQAAAQSNVRSVGAAPTAPTAPPPGDEGRGWRRRVAWGLALIAALALFVVWPRDPGPDDIIIKGSGDAHAPEVQLYLDHDGAIQHAQTVVSGAPIQVSAYCRQRCVLAVVDVLDGAATRVGAGSYAVGRRETVSVGVWEAPRAEGTHTLTALAVDPDSALAQSIVADAERWAVEGPPRGVGVTKFPLVVTHGD